MWVRQMCLANQLTEVTVANHILYQKDKVSKMVGEKFTPHTYFTTKDRLYFCLCSFLVEFNGTNQIIMIGNSYRFHL